MNTYYEARLEALRLAQQLEGSHKYKMKKAEEFYQFLSQGIVPNLQYPYYITSGYISTNDTITVQNG